MLKHRRSFALNKSIIPFHSLVDESGTGFNLDADPQPMLDAAEVVIAHDVMTDYETIIYGRERLQIFEEQGGLPPLAVIVALDIETDELDRLIAMVESVRGRHDYLAEIG